MTAQLSFATDSLVPLSVPQTTNVVVLHEIKIVWPDGTLERVCHSEDVTAPFEAFRISVLTASRPHGIVSP